MSFGAIDQLHPRSFEAHIDAAKTDPDWRDAEDAAALSPATEVHHR
jgi:hypothetical protein